MRRQTACPWHAGLQHSHKAGLQLVSYNICIRGKVAEERILGVQTEVQTDLGMCPIEIVHPIDQPAWTKAAADRQPERLLIRSRNLLHESFEVSKGGRETRSEFLSRRGEGNAAP